MTVRSLASPADEVRGEILDAAGELLMGEGMGACYHRLLIPDQPLTEAFARTLVDQLVRGLRVG